MGVKPGLSHSGRNKGRGCSRWVLRKTSGPKRDKVRGAEKTT